MKLLLIALSSILFFSLNASADLSCKLETPVSTQGYSFTEYRMDFLEVELYETPEFTHQHKYNPSVNKLDMQLFNIETNDVLTGYIGGNIGADEGGLHTSLGQANVYGGSIPLMSHTSETIAEGTKYTTNIDTWGLDKDGNAYGLKEEVVVVINNNQIISVQFNVPVIKYDENDERFYYRNRTQSLCVKAAELSSVLKYGLGNKYIDL